MAMIPAQVIRHANMDSPIRILRIETFYCGFSPELSYVAYGSCRDEVLNELQEEVDRRAEVVPARSHHER
jgi:hypothetical protein